MSTEVVSIQDQIQKYSEPAKFNLLLPSKSVQEISEFHRLTLDEVQLDVNDAYPLDNTDPKKASEFFLSKVNLLKLSSCAGIIWDTVRSGVIKSDRMYVLYKAVGAMQKSDGTWIPVSANYELDLEVLEDEIRERVERRAAQIDFCANRNAERDRWAVDQRTWKNEKGKQDWIASKLKSEMLKKRRFKVQLAETGAMNRVIRALLGTKSSYTREELAKPFVVPRIVFRPNLSDPEVKSALIAQSMLAVGALGHQPPALPAASDAPPIDVTAETSEAELV